MDKEIETEVKAKTNFMSMIFGAPESNTLSESNDTLLNTVFIMLFMTAAFIPFLAWGFISSYLTDTAVSMGISRTWLYGIGLITMIIFISLLSGFLYWRIKNNRANTIAHNTVLPKNKVKMRKVK